MSAHPPIKTNTKPTEIGQRVRSQGYGGQVRRWMEGGVVIGFTKTGFPKILADSADGCEPTTVIDRAYCFAVVDADNRWVYRWVEEPAQ